MNYYAIQWTYFHFINLFFHKVTNESIKYLRSLFFNCFSFTFLGNLQSCLTNRNSEKKTYIGFPCTLFTYIVTKVDKTNQQVKSVQYMRSCNLEYSYDRRFIVEMLDRNSYIIFVSLKHAPLISDVQFQFLLQYFP